MIINVKPHIGICKHDWAYGSAVTSFQLNIDVSVRSFEKCQKPDQVRSNLKKLRLHHTYLINKIAIKQHKLTTFTL